MPRAPSACTPCSIFPEAESDPDALRAELDRIRADGYALDRGRLFSCVAAPVTRPDGAIVAAIAAVLPSSRFEAAYPVLTPAIVAVGHALGAVLRPDLDTAGTPLGSRPVLDLAVSAAMSKLIKTPAMDWDRSDL